MNPKKYLHKLAAAVSKRSGISIATLEVALPALFDEMRYILCEGDYRIITIESFGTIRVAKRPARHYLRRYPDGHTEMKELEPRLILKFLPTTHMKREVEQSKFDPTRHSFELHPDDCPIRARRKMEPRKHKQSAETRNMHMVGYVEKEEKGTGNRKMEILRGKKQE